MRVRRAPFDEIEPLLDLIEDHGDVPAFDILYLDASRGATDTQAGGFALRSIVNSLFSGLIDSFSVEC